MLYFTFYLACSSPRRPSGELRPRLPDLFGVKAKRNKINVTGMLPLLTSTPSSGRAATPSSPETGYLFSLSTELLVASFMPLTTSGSPTIFLPSCTVANLAEQWPRRMPWLWQSRLPLRLPPYALSTLLMIMHFTLIPQLPHPFAIMLLTILPLSACHGLTSTKSGSVSSRSSPLLTMLAGATSTSPLPIGSSPRRAPMPLLVLLLPSSPAEAQTLSLTSRLTSLMDTFRLQSALGSSEDASLPFPSQEIPNLIGSSGPSPSARPSAELSRWLRLGNTRIDSRPTSSRPRLAHPTHPPSLMARPGLPKSESLAAQASSSPRTPCELSSTRTRRGSMSPLMPRTPSTRSTGAPFSRSSASASRASGTGLGPTMAPPPSSTYVETISPRRPS